MIKIIKGLHYFRLLEFDSRWLRTVRSSSGALRLGVSFAFQGIKIIYFVLHYHFWASLSSIALSHLFTYAVPEKRSLFLLLASWFRSGQMIFPFSSLCPIHLLWSSLYCTSVHTRISETLDFWYLCPFQSPVCHGFSSNSPSLTL